MKFCMECGQKSPPMAKFCPGCGTSMSLKGNARVEADEDAHDLPEKDIKDIQLSKDAITFIGDAEEVTIRDVLDSTPEGYKPERGYRRPDKRLAGLSKAELRSEMHRWNTESDGSREA